MYQSLSGLVLQRALSGFARGGAWGQYLQARVREPVVEPTVVCGATRAEDQIRPRSLKPRYLPFSASFMWGNMPANGILDIGRNEGKTAKDRNTSLMCAEFRRSAQRSKNGILASQGLQRQFEHRHERYRPRNRRT
jgi:hypothetical protein